MSKYAVFLVIRLLTSVSDMYTAQNLQADHLLGLSRVKSKKIAAH